MSPPDQFSLSPDSQGSESWEELISERVFGQEMPPRWVLAVSRDQLLLIDRQKWAASRLLRFELNTLLGESNPDAVLAAATLLHREHTCPTGGGTPLLDELDENSHKHAYEVSGDLKYALRRSIELLGNEVVAFIKGQKKGVFEERLAPEQLTLELLLSTDTQKVLTAATKRSSLFWGGLPFVSAVVWGVGWGCCPASCPLGWFMASGW